MRKRGKQNSLFILAVIAIFVLFLVSTSGSFGFFSLSPQSGLECTRLEANKILVALPGTMVESLLSQSSLGYGEPLGNNMFLFDVSGGIPPGFYSFEVVTGFSKYSAGVNCK